VLSNEKSETVFRQAYFGRSLHAPGRIPPRRSHIPRPLISPRSPGPAKQPCEEYEPPRKWVTWQLLLWKLIPLQLDPPNLKASRPSRPPRCLLHLWDIRVRRYTSPTATGSYPATLTSASITSAAEGDRRANHTYAGTEVRRRSQ